LKYPLIRGYFFFFAAFFAGFFAFFFVAMMWRSPPPLVFRCSRGVSVRLLHLALSAFGFSAYRSRTESAETSLGPLADASVRKSVLPFTIGMRREDLSASDARQLPSMNLRASSASPARARSGAGTAHERR
jgi:hypothetical protein